MDNKRKSHGSSAGDVDGRAAKRQKVPPQQLYDLFQGESNESTTQYGFHFLEQIRKTSDKSGRQVAGYFDRLIPRSGNEDYYKRTRMLISLETIEQKLHERYFANMSELESYVKRMVQNAKDWYPRTSQIFEDAERVRKALSNYMVKINPAYKLVAGYSAVPTPLPESDGELDDDADADADADVDADAEGELDDVNGEDQDAEGEEDDEEDVEEDSDAPRSRARGPGRPPKDPSLHAQRMAERVLVPGSGKPDHQYENVPYQGLSFQQAQEKIVEELLRKPDDSDPGYAYFDAFLNLPSRSLKDYYSVIKEPLSLKKLQKLVKGIHGRGEKTGSSDYKSWAAFEEKSALLWKNAYFYNEDGSEIVELAKELEETFRKELGEAKAAVPEPPQPKIKLKVPSSHEVPIAIGPKKITIHVANTRGSSAESPAQPTTGSVSSDGVPNGNMARNPFSGQNAAPLVNLGPLDKARSMSGSVPSPGSSVVQLAMKPDVLPRQSPAVMPRPNGVPHGAGVPPYNPHPYHSMPFQNGHAPPMAQTVAPYENKFRTPGRGLEDALIKNLTIRTHPSIATERRFRFQVLPHPKLAQQSVTINIPAAHWKQQIMVTMSPSIHEQQRAYKLFVIVNNTIQRHSIPTPDDPIDPGAKLFEAQLFAGVNTIQVQVIAALPRGQKLPNGSDVELEKITLLANLVKSRGQ